MSKPEQENLPAEEQEKAAELAWLQKNGPAFLAYARHHHAKQGRGAIVIAAPAALGNETPFQYAEQAEITEQSDPVSQRLTTFVAEYDPDREFVAVFIRARAEFEFSMYQIRVGEEESQTRNGSNREVGMVRLN